MESSGCAPRKPDRKTVEKNRRIYIKSLYSKLETLLPSATKDGFAQSIPDCIIGAADYITELRESVEKLRERKRQHIALDSTNSVLTKLLPRIEVQELSRGLKAVKVNIISRNNNSGFYNTIRLLEEEGVKVLNAHLPASVPDIHLLLSM
ncbi:Helix-loop-helix DNA-binding domain-containing protein [Carex littledalei]|uniref:Helix-loop-helix DNA-binding domain-containing protein n=1 Tax=Carex littledalei TaxID=544730 RepID=A0A833QJ85_9POAL|nr:Helix-loop-helix DNA-binding domain-containing protein [Carex littledalei]